MFIIIPKNFAGFGGLPRRYLCRGTRGAAGAGDTAFAGSGGLGASFAGFLGGGGGGVFLALGVVSSCARCGVFAFARSCFVSHGPRCVSLRWVLSAPGCAAPLESYTLKLQNRPTTIFRSRPAWLFTPVTTQRGGIVKIGTFEIQTYTLKFTGLSGFLAQQKT